MQYCNALRMRRLHRGFIRAALSENCRRTRPISEPPPRWSSTVLHSVHSAQWSQLVALPPYGPSQLLAPCFGCAASLRRASRVASRHRLGSGGTQAVHSTRRLLSRSISSRRPWVTSERSDRGEQQHAAVMQQRSQDATPLTTDALLCSVLCCCVASWCSCWAICTFRTDRNRCPISSRICS